MCTPREHLSRDVFGDFHDRLVADAILSQLGDQRMAVIVPAAGHTRLINGAYHPAGSGLCAQRHECRYHRSCSGLRPDLQFSVHQAEPFFHGDKSQAALPQRFIGLEPAAAVAHFERDPVRIAGQRNRHVFGVRGMLGDVAEAFLRHTVQAQRRVFGDPAPETTVARFSLASLAVSCDDWIVLWLFRFFWFNHLSSDPAPINLQLKGKIT
jgi:hypothetical protein